MENRISKIVPYDDYNHKVGCDYVGAVMQNFGTTAWINGWKLIELYED